MEKRKLKVASTGKIYKVLGMYQFRIVYPKNTKKPITVLSSEYSSLRTAIAAMRMYMAKFGIENCWTVLPEGGENGSSKMCLVLANIRAKDKQRGSNSQSEDMLGEVLHKPSRKVREKCRCGKKAGK